MGCFYLEGNHGEADLFVSVSADQRGGQEDRLRVPFERFDHFRTRFQASLSWISLCSCWRDFTSLFSDSWAFTYWMPVAVALAAAMVVI